ncbi:MAG: ornithine cyclodeaminase family protein [Methylocystis sp.]|uniref:ornithine cyclodeaminase family protein n=1 Tax=Methylocystis sp. TaxID=1911079 RepID=UPI003DA33D43
MPKSIFRIIDAETTCQSLPFKQLIEALDEGFTNDYIAPVRHHHSLKRREGNDATLLLMPTWTESSSSEQLIGVKTVTVFPGNPAKGLPSVTSTYLLSDGETGRQLALIDGNVLTARRTAATSALAARYLSRPDARRLLLIGTGQVARLLPQAYRTVLPIDHIQVWNINRGSAERLAAALNSAGIAASVADDLESAIADADIISAATLSTSPLIRGKWLKPGQHVDLIGSFTPGMREADDEAIRKSLIFVDSTTALHESGDLIQPIESGIIDQSDVVATLPELCKKVHPGRQAPDQITCFKSVGSGVADLIAAKLVFGAP